MSGAAQAGQVQVWLTEPGGHLVGLALPLHKDVEARWRKGHLQRVHADGTPWQDSDGDEFALPGEPAAPDSGSDYHPTGPVYDVPAVTELGGDPAASVPAGGQNRPQEPERPRRNAGRRDWAAYAVLLGAATQADADLLTRDELVELCTPPEMKAPPAG